MKQVLNKLASGFKHSFLILYALLAIVPFLWVIISAFKDNSAIFTAPFALPVDFNMINFTKAWEEAKIGTYFFNSLLISAASVLLQLLVVSMSTYVMTRMIHSQLLTTLFSLGLMIPIHAMLIPNFISISRMSLINSPLSVILVYSACNISFGIFLLSGFMNTIPHELDEAAMIDGAGYVRTFFSILLPVCKPGLATVATFAFLNSWNEFLFASVLLTRQENMTITQGINYLKGQYVTDYGLLCAGLLFAIIPVVVMYILLQEQVVKGMTAGAVKG